MLKLNEIPKIMKDRFAKMNGNPDDEEDFFYCEK